MKRLGDYELGERLGAGAMGSVFAATHVAHGWPAAIKLVTDTGAEGWADPLAELRAVAALDHGHIVRVLDFGRVDEQVWIAMERADGSLAERLPANWEAARVIIHSVLSALAHAHSRGIIHLDVKPENVLVMRRGRGVRWMLADFGLAHLEGVLRPGDDRLRGTPAFMAPEQFVARSDAWGPWTDLYAVGCLVTMLVTGAPPFTTPDARALAMKHRFAEPPPSAVRFAVPEGFEAFRRRLLEKAPADRFLLAADALRAVEALDGASGFVSTPHPAWRAETFLFDEGSAMAVSPAVQTPHSEESEVVPPEQGIRQRVVASATLLDVRALPLVGRADELRVLAGALEEVRTRGVAGWVAVRGPPGIGRRHLMRAFASRAEEMGVAVRGDRQQVRAMAQLNRPVIRVVDEVAEATLSELEVGLTDTAPILFLVRCRVVPPEVQSPLAEVLLDPLAPWLAARLARNLAPLDETVVAALAQSSGGHPGQIVAAVRAWSASGRLIPGDYGLVVEDPAEEGPGVRERLASLDPEAPLSAMAWSVEEDPDAALEQVSRVLDEQLGHGRPARTLALLDIADRAMKRSTTARPQLAIRLASVRASVLNGMGHMLAAADAAAEATALARRSNDPTMLASTLIRQAHLVRFVGGDALALLEEAEQISTTPVHVGQARATRGSILITQGRMEEAREVLRAAADHLRAHEEDRFLGTSLFWLGNAYSYDSMMEEALAHHRQSVAVFERTGNASGLAISAISACSDCLMMRAPEQIGELFETAQAAARSSESPWMLSLFLGMEGWLLEQRGEYERAEDVLRQAVALAEDTDRGSSDLNIRLARVLIHVDRRAEAATLLAQVDGQQVSRHDQVELDVLRVSSMAPDDPDWSTSMAACRTAVAGLPHLRSVVLLARDHALDEASKALTELLEG
jgi:tetratricopeptide (TPR) repeat protein